MSLPSSEIDLLTLIFSGSVASLESYRSSFSSLAAVDNGVNKTSRSTTPAPSSQQQSKENMDKSADHSKSE